MQQEGRRDERCCTLSKRIPTMLRSASASTNITRLLSRPVCTPRPAHALMRYHPSISDRARYCNVGLAGGRFCRIGGSSLPDLQPPLSRLAVLMPAQNIFQDSSLLPVNRTPCKVMPSRMITRRRQHPKRQKGGAPRYGAGDSGKLRHRVPTTTPETRRSRRSKVIEITNSLQLLRVTHLLWSHAASSRLHPADAGIMT
ncbi:hypothetical protein BU26DRAFT_295349 [Trematosphaeria pertusa]|uniref:Uncharacterized protein n=1 Tax=Trematosphaeria pertusa TaxID=390896 RepID=A0A6A6IIP7_9PLEO|nr:uncharacterized protein BU26DRAFT_295349 [Trematosphaeria pertusa]KAF2250089.1 hypothetical protein BU26DRAFT_295349 [Trematosphaeria pertusa]